MNQNSKNKIYKLRKVYDRIPILQIDLEVFSFPEVFCKKGVLENFAKFTGRHLWQSLFLNKVMREAIKEYKRDSGTGVSL